MPACACLCRWCCAAARAKRTEKTKNFFNIFLDMPAHLCYNKYRADEFGAIKNAAVAHLVERHLAKVEVASSSLVSRSKKEKHLSKTDAFLFWIPWEFNYFWAAKPPKSERGHSAAARFRSQALRICIHGVPVGWSRTKSALDGRILCFRASACFTRRCFVLSYQYEKRVPFSIRCARFCYAFPSINRRSFSGVMPVCSAPSHLMHGPSPHCFMQPAI